MPQEGNIVPYSSKITGGEQVNPAILQFIMQASMAAQMSKMRLMEEAKIPTGTKLLKVTVRDKLTAVVLDPPWISFTLINDNDMYNIYYAVNTPEAILHQVPVEPLESADVDYDYPLISTVYLQCGVGESVVVRLNGVVGRKWQP